MWYNPKSWFNKELNEEIKAFRNREEGKLTDKQMEKKSGEGFEVSDFGVQSMGTFNTFFSSYINKQAKTNLATLGMYREMATNPEIADVLDDAVNESLQQNDEGQIISLRLGNDLAKSETLSKNLHKEFKNLFSDVLNVEERIHEWLWSYYVDGVVWFENIINENRHTDGVIGIKRLPMSSMDAVYDKFGRVDAYIQYKSKNTKKPANIEEAKKDPNIIVFAPEQIRLIKYSYESDKLTGYLDKCKIPYNTLKLLETSMIIYRIVRAPERFVFKIDTGNMPRDKRMAYVEKVKNKMTTKQTFNPTTGTLDKNSDITSIMDNFFLPSGENRGSDISTIGGNSAGFKELDDVFYFQKKLYRALKYPISRIENRAEGRSSDNIFQGSAYDEIIRDEIKWAVFLERQQHKFSSMLVEIFLLHLDFLKLKKPNSITRKNIGIVFTPPSNYRSQMTQRITDARNNNYMSLNNEPELSKLFLMKHVLQWDDEKIQENIDLRKKDKEVGLVDEEGQF